jgi:hypothetical protein
VNKVTIQTDDYGIGTVTLNHIRLDGVQSVEYRHDQTGRPIVTLALIAELYQTDEDALFDAQRDTRARAEAQIAELRSRLAATERSATIFGWGAFDDSEEE